MDGDEDWVRIRRRARMDDWKFGDFLKIVKHSVRDIERDVVDWKFGDFLKIGFSNSAFVHIRRIYAVQHYCLSLM
jgi:hypothetical protein